LSHMNPIHIFPSYFPKIHSSIIFLSTHRSSKWYLPFRFSNQNFVCISYVTHAWYMLLQSHPPWLDHPHSILWSIQVMKLLIMQPSSDPCYFLPLKSIYSPQHSVCSLGLKTSYGGVVYKYHKNLSEELRQLHGHQIKYWVDWPLQWKVNESHSGISYCVCVCVYGIEFNRSRSSNLDEPTCQK
jgi:hypothetical protein